MANRDKFIPMRAEKLKVEGVLKKRMSLGTTWFISVYYITYIFLPNRALCHRVEAILPAGYSISPIT